eukprot:scaffold190317_cov30-Tisochrysis_lutea.AAC.1
MATRPAEAGAAGPMRWRAVPVTLVRAVRWSPAAPTEAAAPMVRQLSRKKAVGRRRKASV